MKSCMHHLEHLLESGGIKKDIVPLILSSSALLVSLFDVVPLPFDAAWIAIILCGGKEIVVPAEQVQVGDLLRVLPGESIPVDGVITAGCTSVDQAVMTGESRRWTKPQGIAYPAAL